MNEACLDMQKSGGKRCEYLPKDEDSKMADARDAILVRPLGGVLVIRWPSRLAWPSRECADTQATVRDIEDIVAVGKQSCVCPYYATRQAVKQAHVCAAFPRVYSMLGLCV